jgi:hypothetical protein
MAAKQQTVAPYSLFPSADAQRLRPAADFLLSAGLLQSGLYGLSFLHQTFFDYCFARFFVEDGRQLAAELLDGPQGLDERPLLLHVLSYLRATDQAAYVRELSQLGVATFFETDGLRVHLRELLRRMVRGAAPAVGRGMELRAPLAA